MRKVLTVTRMLLLLVLMFFVYAPNAITAQKDEGAPTKGTSTVSAKSKWEDEWDRTLLAAKKEGSVVIYTGLGNAWRMALADAMLRKYGITLNAMIARSGEIAARVTSEQKAKTYHVDSILVGSSQFVLTFQPQGFLQSLEKVLILPEVKDPKAWWRNELPWVDPDTKTYFQFNDYVSVPIFKNTDLVKPGELESWKDLLNPKWKGKIIINDPTTSGSGQKCMTALAYGIMDWNYIKDLIKQEPILQRDNRLMAEWVARGKYPLNIGARDEEVREFSLSGAPITSAIPSEGTYLTGGNGFVSLAKGAPHPNAAKIFINFLLSKEGQALSSKATGNQSSRIDAPTDHLQPWNVRQPGKKYVSTTSQEFLEKEVELKKRVAELFKPLK